MISYSVVLAARHQGVWHTVRVYDNAHGRDEMHRHTFSGGKQPGEQLAAADHGQAMRSARREILIGYEKMIEAWRS